MFVEEEFRDVFNPTRNDWAETDPAEQVDKVLQTGYRLDQNGPLATDGPGIDANHLSAEKFGMDEKHQDGGGFSFQVPSLAISSP